MKIYNSNEIELPASLTLVGNGKEYSVQVRDVANPNSWWGVTIPAPSLWFRALRLLKPRSMRVVFMQDRRLKFEHIILVPIQVEGHETAQSYKIPTKKEG